MTDVCVVVVCAEVSDQKDKKTISIKEGVTFRLKIDFKVRWIDRCSHINDGELYWTLRRY